MEQRSRLSCSSVSVEELACTRKLRVRHEWIPHGTLTESRAFGLSDAGRTGPYDVLEALGSTHESNVPSA